jgi:hypothetical protein
MSDLKGLIRELSQREMTRKQFIVLVGGSFLGMFGFFRLLQQISTPGFRGGDPNAFGAKDYGHVLDEKRAQAKGFGTDTFS